MSIRKEQIIAGGLIFFNLSLTAGVNALTDVDLRSLNSFPIDFTEGIGLRKPVSSSEKPISTETTETALLTGGNISFNKSPVAFKSSELINEEEAAAATWAPAIDGSRSETGEDGETLPFHAGQSVLGEVEFSSGKKVNGLIVDSPLGGALLRGILNPSKEETDGKTPLSDEVILENPPYLPTLPQSK